MTHPDWKAYAEATAARPGEARALADRALSPRRRAVWLLVPVVAMAAAAAWMLWPAPAFDVPLAADPVAVEWIHLEPAGVGRLQGQGREATIEWTTGSVRVAVEPGRGMRVAVRTPDALVRVIGTRFTVDRDALGTTVSVEEGQVAVACADGTTDDLDPDEAVTCWPTDPVDLLGRVVALARAGASNEDLLATIERGLASSPDPTVHSELLEWRATVLANR